MTRILFLALITVSPLSWSSSNPGQEASTSEKPSIFDVRAEKGRQNLERRWGHNEVLDGPVQAEEEKPGTYRDPQIDFQSDFGEKEGSVD